MKNSLIKLSALSFLAFASYGCGLFQAHCKCEDEIAAAKLSCQTAPVEAVAPFPLTTTDKDGNLKDLSEVAATHGGDIEPSSALESSDKMVAQADNDEDPDAGFEDDTDEGSDELPSTNQDGLPDGITPSQMDQILPSNATRQRIDIPDAARSAVQIPVLTSLKPNDPAWEKEIAPKIRDINNTEAQDAGLRALTGNFLPRFSGKSTALITPGSQIEIDTPGRHTIKRTISEDYRSPLLAAIWPYPVYAAQLINDDPLEIVVIGVDKEGESDSIIMEIYKIFGARLGRIFKTEIGIISDKKIIKTAQIEFVSGKNDIGIRRTPIDSKGNPDTSNAVVYDWNPWEGAYRTNQKPERERLGPPSWTSPVNQDNIAP